MFARVGRQSSRVAVAHEAFTVVPEWALVNGLGAVVRRTSNFGIARASRHRRGAAWEECRIPRFETLPGAGAVYSPSRNGTESPYRPLEPAWGQTMLESRVQWPLAIPLTRYAAWRSVGRRCGRMRTTVGSVSGA